MGREWDGFHNRSRGGKIYRKRGERGGGSITNRELEKVPRRVREAMGVQILWNKDRG